MTPCASPTLWFPRINKGGRPRKGPAVTFSPRGKER
jgi:hypothetical protein